MGKSMMEYERKCQWVSPGTPRPTPAPSTTPGCKGWCLQNAKPWDKKCTWAGCAGCDQCQATPTPTPSPTLVPPTSSVTITTTSTVTLATTTPTTLEPSGCSKFCGHENLGTRSCWVYRDNEEFCVRSYRYNNDVVEPCKWTGSKCKSDKPKTMTCPTLASLCSNPTPMPTPAPTQIPSACKPWCTECPMKWSKKCMWRELCGACPDCMPDFKALAWKLDSVSCHLNVCCCVMASYVF